MIYQVNCLVLPSTSSTLGLDPGSALGRFDQFPQVQAIGWSKKD